MANSDAVYHPTTAAAPTTGRCFSIPNSNLSQIRFCVKIAEVLLSFVAFVLEEVVSSCTSCGALYFFEFVSCTAFLFTLLLLILLSTPLHQKVGITCWPKLDFIYSALISILLFIASIVFAANNNGSEVERATVTFGFIALIAFLVDIFLFWRENGSPFANRAPQVAQPDPEPENVKLNANGTSGTNGTN